MALCLTLAVLLVPIIKDKGVKINKDNYQPMPIAIVISKVLERIILNKSKHCLLMSDNQLLLNTWDII